jgi:hypothetical protein
MKSCRFIALRVLTALVLALGILPSQVWAQAATGGGRGGMGAMQQIRTVIPQLDLTDDQKSKIKDILTQAQQDMRDKMQGMQDATQEERQARMQDLQKLAADTREKVEAELTDDQKAKYYPLMAQAALKQFSDLLAAVKTAAAKQDISDDLRKQLGSALDDTQKTLDGYKTDADAVKDAAGLTEFQQKVTKTQMDTRTEIVDILGQDDTQTLMQAARQAMRPGGNAQAAKPDAVPTIAPDAK